MGLTLIALVLVLRPVVAGDFAGPATAKDGDDLVIGGVDIRLSGIDAFEIDQKCEANGKLYPCGQEAKQALAGKVAGQIVTCEQRDYDTRNDRPVAVCVVNGEDINAWMVSQGWAIAYRQYSLDYIDEEDFARAAQVGAWRGQFIPPWEWRRGKRLPQEAGIEGLEAPTTGCVIKGNISNSGERIYHVPGQQHYDETQISEAKGERWFCTEQEAIAAGWRKAKR